MLWTILVVLLLLWLIGFYGGFVTTNLIHLLLLGAAIVLALNLFKPRNPA
ncbi:MAG TPA: lmo0937 family membrane protein [Pyrinomonadaceae bacterium]|nr:lmo0937 family membrane protein [Pyrinomonadaceae bacterium]